AAVQFSGLLMARAIWETSRGFVRSLMSVSHGWATPAKGLAVSGRHGLLKPMLSSEWSRYGTPLIVAVRVEWPRPDVSLIVFGGPLAVTPSGRFSHVPMSTMKYCSKSACCEPMKRVLSPASHPLLGQAS